MEGKELWSGWQCGPLAAIHWHGEWFLLHVASELVLAGHRWPTLGELKAAAERVLELDVWEFNREQAIRAQATGYIIPPEVSRLLAGAPA